MNDFKAFKKLETLPPSRLAGATPDDERLLVLVKLRRGATLPAYVKTRAQISAQMVSGEIQARELARIDADPAVESVAVSQRLPSVY